MALRALGRGNPPDSAARLRALTRRAYTATAGHLDLDDDGAGREFDRIVSGDAREDPDMPNRAAPTGRRAAPTRRWVVSGRAVLAVLVVVAALAGVVVARVVVLGPSDAVPLPELTADPWAPSTGEQIQTADDQAPAPPTADDQPVGSGANQAAGGRHGATGSTSGGAGSATSSGGAVTAEEGGDSGHGGDDPGAVAVVHVAGAVREPGVVELPVGARVSEAIDAAGGGEPDAELAAVNLARPVQDGEQVYVPRVGEAAPGTAAGPGGAGGPSGPGGAGGPAEPAGPGEKTGDGGTVDLNTADLAELDTLPGVGPAIAQRILDWRQAHGPFHAVDELLEVSGIGPATMDRLRERVRV